MGESDSFSSYWPKYEKITKKKKKKRPNFPAELKRAIYFQQCKQIKCDRKLLKRASFERACAGHLIGIQKTCQRIHWRLPGQPE